MKNIVLETVRKYIETIDTCLKQNEYSSFLCLELFEKKLGLKLKRITTCPEYDVEALEFAKKLLEELYERLLVIMR